jgi:hypothetical protein
VLGDVLTGAAVGATAGALQAAAESLLPGNKPQTPEPHVEAGVEGEAKVEKTVGNEK